MLVFFLLILNISFWWLDVLQHLFIKVNYAGAASIWKGIF